MSHLPLLWLGQGPFPPPELFGFLGSTNPSAIHIRQRWSSRIRCRFGLSRPPTVADFPCCTSSISHACRRHYPGGIIGCVSRSLPRRLRPSSLLWRVGFHIFSFEACSTFTRVTARMDHWPHDGAFSQSASGHSLPPDPPRVFTAGARVSRPGLSPGRIMCLCKAHTIMFPSAK